ncbi:MAG: fimbria/pilus periplasmic chaperone [Daejeonella sp.]|uniref:fimbrial biogenesis chaperone n=1 Tax=Daejeonella sp. TaxID=2805397 RepID=UPI003C714A7C
MFQALLFIFPDYSKLFISGFILFLFTSSECVTAQGNLLITPKRIVFEGQKRSQDINLANIGNDTARYEVSFIQIRMKEDGNFEQITQPDSGQFFADKNLRLFPRVVTLGPNEAQLIKIQVSHANKLSPGEYRSHLYFRAVPNKDPLGETPVKADTAGVSVRIVPVFGISIPVIIRAGESTAKVSLSRLELEGLSDSLQVMKVRFNRTGNFSVYGDLKIEHISENGKITQVGHIKGISVYAPNLKRDVKVNLDHKPGVNYRSGKLLVSYASSTEGQTEPMAWAELLLK